MVWVASLEKNSTASSGASHSEKWLGGCKVVRGSCLWRWRRSLETLYGEAPWRHLLRLIRLCSYLEACLFRRLRFLRRMVSAAVPRVWWVLVRGRCLSLVRRGYRRHELDVVEVRGQRHPEPVPRAHPSRIDVCVDECACGPGAFVACRSRTSFAAGKLSITRVSGGHVHGLTVGERGRAWPRRMELRRTISELIGSNGGSMSDGSAASGAPATAAADGDAVALWWSSCAGPGALCSSLSARSPLGRLPLSAPGRCAREVERSRFVEVYLYGYSADREASTGPTSRLRPYAYSAISRASG